MIEKIIRFISLLLFFTLLIILISVISIFYSQKVHSVGVEGISSTNNFGKTEYECLGTCYCEIYRRSSSSRNVLSKGMNYVIYAFSTAVALRFAEKYLHDDCTSHFSEICPSEFIRSEVEECHERLAVQSSSDDFGKFKYKEFSQEYIDEKRKTQITMEPIGIIHSQWVTPLVTPIFRREYEGTFAYIEIFEEFSEGLDSLEPHTSIFVFYIFDQNEDMGSRSNSYVNPDPDNPKKVSVFASRFQYRPNNMGMTVVKIVKVEKNIIHIDGIDAFNGSPVIDIKPYSPLNDEVIEN